MFNAILVCTKGEGPPLHPCWVYPAKSYRGDDGLSLVQMANHVGIDENDVPQTPGLTPHVQSVHNLVQAWKVCVMHCNGLLAAITHYVH